MATVSGVVFSSGLAANAASLGVSSGGPGTALGVVSAVGAQDRPDPKPAALGMPVRQNAPGVVTKALGHGMMQTTFSPVPAASRGKNSPSAVGSMSYSSLVGCLLSSASPTQSVCGAGSDPETIGRDASGNVTRGLLTLADPSQLGLPTDAHIVGAKLAMPVQSTSSPEPALVAQVVTRPWSTSSASWQNASTGVAWSTPGGDVDTTTPGYQTTGFTSEDYGGHDDMVITQAVADWVSGAKPVTGLLLRLADESKTGSVTLAGLTDDSSGNAPQIVVTWSAEIGNQDTAMATTRNLDDRTRLSLNSANGNPTVQASVLNLPGLGQGVQLGYAINGNANQIVTAFDRASLQLTDSVYTSAELTYVQPDGFGRTFVRTSPTTFATPPGIDATMTQSASDDSVTLRFNDTGVTNHYAWADGDEILTSTVDAQGNTTTYTYTGSQLTKITDPQGKTVTMTYGSATDPFPTTVHDDSLGRTVTLAWSDQTVTPIQLLSVTDAAGGKTSYTYSSTGLNDLTSITTPTGHVTTLSPDPNEPYGMTREASVTFGSGSSAASTYSFSYPATSSSSASGTTKVTDARGGVTTYTYDLTDRVIGALDPLGHSTSATWSAANKPLTLTNGIGGITSFTYDGLNNLTKVTAPAGGGSTRTASYAYPAPTGALSDYLPTSSTDGQGNTTSYAYNALNEPSTATTPGGLDGTLTKKYQGDPGVSCGAKPGELCTSINGNGATTTYAYDAKGNVTTITPPAPMGTTKYGYDAGSRKTSMTDGNGTKTTYTLDAMDRITKAVAGTSTITYTYDADGNLTKRVDPSGTTTYTYDAQNHPLTKTTPTGATSSTWDANGNMTSLTDPGGKTTYGYDAANRVTALAEPGGSCPSTPTFPNTTGCTAFGYDNAGHRTSVTFPAGQTQALTYDTAGRELSVTSKKADGTTLVARTYSYTKNGTDTDLRQSVTDQAGTTTTYGYDALNRLTTATTGTTTSTYTYDKNDNRLSIATTGAATVNAAYNAADQLCWTSTTTPGTAGTGGCPTAPSGATTYTYDGAGNRSTGAGTSFTYTPFNQQRTVTPAGASAITATYSDITSDERTNNNGQTYVNALTGVTRQTGTNTLEFVRDPKGSPIALRQTTGTTTTSSYYTLDALGSVILLTDSTGGDAARYTYDPLGRTLTSTGPLAGVNPYTYATGYTDPAGLLKLGTRSYDPTTGVFTQLDPAQQGASWYTYAGANPINHTDPTGRVYLSYQVSACAGLCIHGGVDVGDGGTRFTGGFGSGAAGGADVSLTVHPGESSSGWSSSFECNAGPVTGGVERSSSGEMADYVGLTSASEGGCSVNTDYTS